MRSGSVYEKTYDILWRFTVVNYYQVRVDLKSQGWRLYHGATALDSTLYRSVPAAKLAGFQLTGEIPIYTSSDEVPFDRTNGLHRALTRIEARSTESKVVAVGSKHYLIRRLSSNFTVEVAIKYKVLNSGAVKARGVTELIESSESLKQPRQL